MFCIRCGTRTEGEAKFCPNCGAKSVTPKTQASDNSSSVPVTDSEVNEPLEVVQDANMNFRGLSTFYKLLVFCLGICVTIEIVLILNNNFDLFHLRILMTTVYLFAFAVLNFNYSKLYKKSNYNFLAVIGIAFSAIFLVAYLLSTWGVVNLPNSEFIVEVLMSMLVASFAIYHASFILIIDYKNSLAKLLSSIAKLLIFITYSLIIVYIFTGIYSANYLKGFFIIAILTAFLTVATRLLNE